KRLLLSGLSLDDVLPVLSKAIN
ncbi:hypothetical protein MNBD_DELTA03-1897, partial [hydrothermal vent metagenome]